jgi:hypothetical protein
MGGYGSCVTSLGVSATGMQQDAKKHLVSIDTFGSVSVLKVFGSNMLKIGILK